MGLGKGFETDRWTGEGLVIVARCTGLDLERADVLTLRAAAESGRVTIVPTGSPQQLTFFCCTCPTSGVNRMKHRETELETFDLKLICIFGIFTHKHLNGKKNLWFLHKETNLF